MRTCEYCGCDNSGELISVEIEDEKVLLCPKHVDNINDETGYCGVSCQLGYGCDQSC